MQFTFEGKTPQIHESVFVAPTASVIGDVVIGEKSSVWFGAVLRGDFNPIRIGKGTCIQDNVVLHGEVTIGDNCTIAHGAIVHDSRVGNDVLVATGALVFGDCVIGDGAIIGMGAVIPPRTHVPPDTLWLGVPAQQMEELSKEQAERRSRGPRTYVELRGRYLAQGAFQEVP